MARLLLAAAAVAAVAGLHVHDGPSDAPSGDTRSRTGDATVLDPELTNAALEKFHITLPGEHPMIILPENADESDPASAELLVYANFSKLTDAACEDLLIRTVTIEGSTLGQNVTKLVFNVGNDNFNDTDAAEYTYTMVRGAQVRSVTKTASGIGPLHLYENVPQCRMSVPRGYLRAPTYKSFLKRSRFMELECSLEFGKHEIKVFWNTVWRGESSPGVPVYHNDLAFSISNVEGAGGLLGNQDHTDETRAVPGCDKKQPLMGPYQTRKKARGKPWQRRHFR